MPTKPQLSILNNLRRPSGGLGGTINGLDIDWEPGDPPIPYNAKLSKYWNALKRHMTTPRPPVICIVRRPRHGRANPPKTGQSTPYSPPQPRDLP